MDMPDTPRCDCFVQIPYGSLFPASVVALYCCYLAYSALQSEPHDYACNGLGQRLNAASGTTLAIGMGIALARCLAHLHGLVQLHGQAAGHREATCEMLVLLALLFTWSQMSRVLPTLTCWLAAAGVRLILLMGRCLKKPLALASLASQVSC